MNHFQETQKLQRLIDDAQESQIDFDEAAHATSMALTQTLLMILAQNPDVQCVSVRFERAKDGFHPIVGFELVRPPVFFTIGTLLYRDMSETFFASTDTEMLKFEASIQLKLVLEKFLIEQGLQLRTEMYALRASRSRLNAFLGADSVDLGEAFFEMAYPGHAIH